MTEITFRPQYTEVATNDHFLLSTSFSMTCLVTIIFFIFTNFSTSNILTTTIQMIASPVGSHWG